MFSAEGEAQYPGLATTKGAAEVLDPVTLDSTRPLTPVLVHMAPTGQGTHVVVPSSDTTANSDALHV